MYGNVLKRRKMQDRLRRIQESPKLLQRASEADTRGQYFTMERKTVLEKARKTTKYVQKTKNIVTGKQIGRAHV